MVKKPIPRTRSRAPKRNIRIVPDGMGVRTTLATRTIIVIGRTDVNASFNFSYNILFTEKTLIYLRKKINKRLF
jgi:hypothetical protein